MPIITYNYNMDVIIGTRLKQMKVSIPKEFKWKRNGSLVCFII